MPTSVKMLAPNETLVWLPKAAVPDYTALTKAILNGSSASNISCAVVAGYTLNPTDPQTDNTKSICDASNVDNPTIDQYEGSLTFFRDADTDVSGTGVASVYNLAFSLFSQGDADGYLVRRVGALSSAQFDSGDDIQVFGFTTDLPKSVDGGDNPPPVQFTVKFIPSGEVSDIYTLA